MRRTVLWLLAIFVTVLVVPWFLLTSSYAADPGVGIGIRKDAPSYATINSTISYSITVYNLGSYPITNVVVTDLFPNLTSVSWSVPDLSPMGQLGDSYNLTNILYTVRQQDVTSGWFVENDASVTGEATIQGFTETVSATTSIVTFISVPVVGGFTVNINNGEHSTHTATYTVLVFILAAALPVYGTFRRKHLTAANSPRH